MLYATWILCNGISVVSTLRSPENPVGCWTRSFDSESEIGAATANARTKHKVAPNRGKTRILTYCRMRAHKRSKTQKNAADSCEDGTSALLWQTWPDLVIRVKKHINNYHVIISPISALQSAVPPPRRPNERDDGCAVPPDASLEPNQQPS